MIRRFFLNLVCLAVTATAGFSATINYSVTVDTSGLIGQSGFLDFSFNQANAATSLAATATISNFQQTGFTFGGNDQTSGVSGTLNALPVVIPNDQNAANFYTQTVVNFGTAFSFDLLLSGPAIGGNAQDGSAFRVTLFNGDFSFKVSPLPDGEVANVIINGDGTTTPNGSIFIGGSAQVAATNAIPEPATVLLCVAGLGIFGLLRKRR